MGKKFFVVKQDIVGKYNKYKTVFYILNELIIHSRI